MHELSVALELLSLCEQRLAARKGQLLREVRIAVGELASIDPTLLSMAWAGVVAGGPHAGAALHVEWRPAVQCCGGCGEIAERQPGTWLRLCPRCCQPLNVTGGDELDLLSLATVPAAGAPVSP